jgi:hypothetical protein
VVALVVINKWAMEDKTSQIRQTQILMLMHWRL